MAVTVACWLVDSTVTATPLSFVVATPVDKAPAVVVNSTGDPTSALPLMSSTVAVMVAWPPCDETDCGFALSTTRATAAVPTEILSAPVLPVVAPPDTAVIVAVPLEPFAKNVAVARPPTSVLTSEGSTRPSVVANVRVRAAVGRRSRRFEHLRDEGYGAIRR